MFDFSFGKLAIIFTLCLIVLGPEKLPKLAQTLGRFAGQARAMARHFRTQLEQEIDAGELAKQKQELEAAVRSTVDSVSAPITQTTETVQQAAAEIEPIIEPMIDPASANGSGHGDYSIETEVASSNGTEIPAAEPPAVIAPPATEPVVTPSAKSA